MGVEVGDGVDVGSSDGEGEGETDGDGDVDTTGAYFVTALASDITVALDGITVF